MTLYVNQIRDVSGGTDVDINGFTLTESNMTGRNILHNGAMRVQQQPPGAASLTESALRGIDRWTADIDAAYTAGMRATYERVEDGPQGFSYSSKITITTPIAREAVTGGRIDFYQRLEGLDAAPLSYGDETARTSTVSFWVKSNVTGTFNIQYWGVVAGQNDYEYVAEYTIDQPDVWEHKYITVPGAAFGVWAADNNAQFGFGFGLGRTADLNVPPGSWQSSAVTGNPGGSPGAVWLGEAAGNYWQVTGVQLELGTVATPYDYRRYNEELLTCYRYYQRTNCYGAYYYLASGIQYNTTTGYLYMQLPAPMRTVPTLTLSAPADFQVLNGAATNITALSIAGVASETGSIGLTYSGSGTTGRGAVLRSDSGANVYLALDASI